MSMKEEFSFEMNKVKGEIDKIEVVSLQISNFIKLEKGSQKIADKSSLRKS